MKKILVIEDDARLRQTLITALEAEGFTAVATSDGQQGLDLALKEKIDLIVLDVDLPTLSGLEVCQRLREKKVLTPIIMISGKKRKEIDKVLGLDLGADGYLIKPFGPHEFIARVRAVLRRSRPESAEIEQYSFGYFHVDFKKQIVTKAKKELHLTLKEFSLLKFLIAHEGEVVSREAILNEVWGYDKFPTTRTVDTFIYNLRQKMEKDPAHPRHLLTVSWSGYKYKK